MTNTQWDLLIRTIDGKELKRPAVGFIIDSPWLPGWIGVSILDYFSSDEVWLKANLKAVETFPEILFLPGFWSEFGMCTEPSAFGARCSFPENEFPHAHPLITSADQFSSLQKPNPKTDGLASFMMNRLRLNREKIEAAGHQIRFSVSRGPLNVASYLMGSTEFLMAMMTHPREVHQLLRIVTDYLIDLHRHQQQTFDAIDGMLVLDDIIGFMGAEQFCEFGLPYFKELFANDVKVKFLHNDAPCLPSAPYLREMGVNLFNMGFDVKLPELMDLTDNKLTMLGNIPPRDVLANGNEQRVEQSVKDLLSSLPDFNNLIVSCGGGMPPGVSTANIQAMERAVKEFKK